MLYNKFHEVFFNRIFSHEILKKIIFYHLLFFLLQNNNFGKTFYIDSKSGNDLNNGSFPDSAWRTIERVCNHQFQAGDSILFKRGEIWKEKFYIEFSGDSSCPIVISAYGIGNKPVLSALDEIPGWNVKDHWIEVKSHVWMMKCSKDPRRLLVDGKEILRTYPLEFVDGVESKWYYNSDTLFLFSTGNPAETVNSLEGNKLYYNVRISGQKHLILENLDIQGGSGNGLSIFGSGYITVKNCNIGLYSYIGIRICMKDNEPSSHITITDNLVDSGFRFYYGPPEKRGVEDGILLSAGAHHCVIKNNKIMDWGHCSIYCYALYEGDHGVYDNIIHNNIITGDNISYCRGIGTDGREGLCRNNLFYHNLIRNTTVRNQINGNHNWIHHNIIDGMKNSPVKKGATAQGIDLQCYGENLVCHDNKIDNNTIMNCEETGIRLRADKNDKSNNYIRNNIIYHCGYQSKDRIGGDNLNYYGIVIDNHESIKGNMFYNNCVYHEGIENVVYYRGTGMDIDCFQAQNGMNGDSINCNIQENPLLNLNENNKYSLFTHSPCIDQGMDIGIDKDYLGNPIPSGRTFDIGAIEYQEENGIFDNSIIIKNNIIVYQNYPNPFQENTVISFEIFQTDFVTIELFNILGEKIETLIQDYYPAGKHEILFNRKKLPNGIYFYSMYYKNIRIINKLIVLK